MSPVTIGILLALGTAVCWCFSSMAFEEAGKRAGSVPVNLIRLFVAFGFLMVAGAVTRGRPLPTDGTGYQWRWLLVSGFVGFFIGDVTLFRALVLMGSRLAALVACTAPIFAMVAEWVLLRDVSISLLQVSGVVITLGGVAWVISERKMGADGVVLERFSRVTPWGLTLALLGSAGQGVGAVMTKRAFEHGAYDAFGTGQIRMVAGIAGFAVFVVATRRLRDVRVTLQNPGAMGYLTLGAFGGPFLGVTLFIMSLKYVSASITQTMTSLVPILMIPLVVATGREKVTWRAVGGTVMAVAGVYVLVRAGR